MCVDKSATRHTSRRYIEHEYINIHEHSKLVPGNQERNWDIFNHNHSVCRSYVRDSVEQRRWWRGVLIILRAAVMRSLVKHPYRTGMEYAGFLPDRAGDQL